MNDIIVRPKNLAQKKALKEIFKKMEIEFEDLKEEIYDPIFVADVNKAKKEADEGKYTVVDIDNLWK
jgi:hypothetical protein